MTEELVRDTDLSQFNSFARPDMLCTFVTLVALSGLGFQNKPIESSDLPAVLSTAPAAPAVEAVAPSTMPPPYPRYYAESFPTTVEANYADCWSSFHATLYSFIFGRDPGIPSASEIEASVYGYGDAPPLPRNPQGE